MTALKSPRRTHTFKREGRIWVAEQWRNSEGKPEYFWKIQPFVQSAPMPGYSEYRRVVEAFEQSLDGKA